MSGNSSALRLWLTAAVLTHFVIAIVHGAAHAEARVPLSTAENTFVVVVILAGPLVGLALTRSAPRLGGWVVGAAMGGALLFGFVNHFVFASPDHVAHVDPQWQPLFATTAVLLFVTEALGSWLAVGLVRERKL